MALRSVGVPAALGALGPSGEVVVLEGQESWPPRIDLAGAPEALWRLGAGEPGARFGERLLGAGDIDGDGVPDLLAGRRALATEPLEWDGVTRFVGPFSMAQAAGAAPAGDFNGDGLADFLIVTPGFDPKGHPGPGRLYVILGAAEMPERVALERLGGRGLELIAGVDQVGALGPGAHRAGDLDGDGSADFAVSELGVTRVVYGVTTRSLFVRGDANGDGRADLSDGVFVLNHLFLGGARPLCDDASDVDDLGTVELTDAVYLLNHLFLGGPAPPSPLPRARTRRDRRSARVSRVLRRARDECPGADIARWRQ